MEIGKAYSGFELLSVTPVEEIDAQVHLFRHRKTGAELIYTGRRDENKTFSIAFQTIPENDTGVFHILEHSVLCGSDKYPVKEPFVELLKGSLNTFLNAMTFPDKTMYPVASRNDADFRNLMRVYLDAVFHPAIYHNENIFRQEGWRYETDENGAPRYVGVVFGEMTGAMSSLEEIVQSNLLNMLFPDNCYGFNSGGDPEHIPDLTYEDFLLAHKRFYHPSNARIFLDGTMEIEDILREIDGEYLGNYEFRRPDFEIVMQERLPYSQRVVSYAVSAEETDADRCLFAMARIAGTWEDLEKSTALSVLGDCLASSNSAPLTRAVLEQGLGESVQLSVDDSMAQSFALLQVRGVSEENLPGLKARLQEMIREIADKGVDREELTASLNRMEFYARERTEPYGVQLAILAAQSWMYGGDPTLYLRVGRVFASLREKLNTTYFEDLLRETFLQEEGLAVLHALPSETLEKELEKKQQDRLNAVYSALSEAEKAALAERSRAVALWQQTPDSEEALKTIPRLDRKEISEKPLLTKVSESVLENVRILRPEIKTAGTVYLDLYFALPGIEPQALSAASLLACVLTELPTAEHEAAQLQREIKTHLGDMSFSVEVFGKMGKPETCTPYFRASVSVLESKASDAIRLLGEVLCTSLMNSPEKIREIVRQEITGQQQSMIASGHQFALSRALSSQTAEGAALEHAGGYAFYQWLRSIGSNFDQAFPALSRSLTEISAKFTAANLTVCVVGGIGDKTLLQLCRAFPQGEQQDARLSIEGLTPKNEALIIPAGIGYAVRAADLSRAVDRKRGSMALMSKLLSLEYLWNEVRVQGGAYGAGLGVTPGGSIFSYSYRDPNPAGTLGVYERAAEFLRKCCESGKELEPLIIGAVSDSEPLRSAHQASHSAAVRILRGITEEELTAQRKELLNATHADLLECARILEEAMRQSSTCVAAGETLADACPVSFDQRLYV